MIAPDIELDPISNYDIDGNVTDSATSSPVSGATVAVTPVGGMAQVASVTTDSNGDYLIQSIQDGSYVLSVTVTGYAQHSEIVTISGSNETVNVSLIPAGSSSTYDVIGQVTDSVTGLPVAGVAVSLSGGARAAITDSNGDYTIAGVADGSYTLSVTMSGYVSHSQAINVSGADLTVDAALNPSVPGPGAYSVSGKVTDNVSGAPIAGAAVTLSGGAGTATTDSNGNYAITGVADGSYNLNVNMSGYASYNQAINVSGASLTVDVALSPAAPGPGTYSVSGKATDKSTGKEISGVMVSVNGGAGSDTTDSNGKYNIAGLPDGAYTIVASKNGYELNTATITINGSNITYNFVLTAKSGSSSGGGRVVSVNNKIAVIELEPDTIYVEDSATATVISIKKDGAPVKLISKAIFEWKIRNDSVASIKNDNGDTITLAGLKVGRTSVGVVIKNDGVLYEGWATLEVIKTANSPSLVSPEVQPKPSDKKVFSDVKADYWGYTAISLLAGKSIVSGYEDGTYRPGLQITRNEFVTMLVKSNNYSNATQMQITSAANHFDDWEQIPDWAKGFWAVAYSNKLLEGTLSNGKYYAEGGRSISHQEVCVVFAKLIDKENTESVYFADADEIAPWAGGAVSKCAANSLISGYTDKTFKPNNPITRAECATIFYNYLAR